MIRTYHRIRNYVERQKLKQNDIHAGILLDNILSQGKYFPAAGSAINLHSIAAVVNDVIINRRESVIEFGAGLSTLCFARMVRDFDLSTTIVAVEDNEQWLQLMRERLAAEGLEDKVLFAHAPLSKCLHAKNGLDWYDTASIESATQSIPFFDSVLVDGPMAWDKPRALSRYPAVPFIKPKLGKSYAIFLDDTHRDGERQIADWWANELGAKKTKVNSNFLMLNKGEYFNPII